MQDILDKYLIFRNFDIFLNFSHSWKYTSTQRSTNIPKFYHKNSNDIESNKKFDISLLVKFSTYFRDVSNTLIDFCADQCEI